MKKKITSYLLISTLLLLSIVQAGCFGEFHAVNKVYDWNQKFGDRDSRNGKATRSLIMLGLLIIPVYKVAAIIDIFGLHVLEFWTGSNPLAMQKGECEEQLITKDGVTYRIRATKNTFHLSEMKDNRVVQEEQIVYDPATLSWNVARNEGLISIATASVNSEGGMTFSYPTCSGIVLRDIDQSHVEAGKTEKI